MTADVLAALPYSSPESFLYFFWMIGFFLALAGQYIDYDYFASLKRAHIVPEFTPNFRVLWLIIWFLVTVLAALSGWFMRSESTTDGPGTNEVLAFWILLHIFAVMLLLWCVLFFSHLHQIGWALVVLTITVAVAITLTVLAFITRVDAGVCILLVTLFLVYAWIINIYVYRRRGDIKHTMKYRTSSRIAVDNVTTE